MTFNPDDMRRRITGRATLIKRQSAVEVDGMLQAEFKSYDKDGNGVIDSVDLYSGLRELGLKVTEKETAQLLEKLDKDKNGKLTIDEFRVLHEEFIQDVFDQFDQDKSGYIDSVELRNAFIRMGVEITTVEAQKLIDMLDTKQDKRLDVHEFRDLYVLLKAQMSGHTLKKFFWDPDVRQLVRQWVITSKTVELGEAGLSAPIPAVKSKNMKDNPGLRMMGGMLSGVIEALLLTPLDVTKTRMQLDRSGRYSGFVDCGKKLYTSEGAAGLYKGFTPWTTHVVLKNGTRFYFNAIFKSILADRNGQLTGTREFLAGGMAGIAEACLIVTPFEVIKTRMQAQDKAPPGTVLKYGGSVGTTMTIIRNEGPLALWKGVVPTMARQGVNQACSFWSNNFIKKQIWKLQDGDTLPAWKSGLTGMLGAIPGPLINNPADVIKSRLMAQETKSGEAPKYKGTVHAFGLIFKEEGPVALYKGLVPRLMRLCPSYGIQWVVIDQFIGYFGEKKKKALS